MDTFCEVCSSPPSYSYHGTCRILKLSAYLLTHSNIYEMLNNIVLSFTMNHRRILLILKGFLTGGLTILNKRDRKKNIYRALNGATCFSINPLHHLFYPFNCHPFHNEAAEMYS